MLLIRFFCHFLVLFALHLASTSMCRFIASIFRNIVVATTCGTLVLSMMYVFGGFILPRCKVTISCLISLLLNIRDSKLDCYWQIFGVVIAASLPPWLRWAFWVSPMSYGEIAVTLNEFRAPRWQKVKCTLAKSDHPVVPCSTCSSSFTFILICRSQNGILALVSLF